MLLIYSYVVLRKRAQLARHDTNIDSLKSHYQSLFRRFGDSYLSAQYSSKASQHRRFRILTEIADLNDVVVLDYGCGTGELLDYLKTQGISIQNYIGVDIVPEFLEIARAKFPQYNFIEGPGIQDLKFDFALISGVFNNKLDDNRAFWQKTISSLYSSCRRGIAFNLMSNYVDYFDPELFYESPEEVFRFIKNNVSPYVTLRHDFDTKPGTIPFEFAIYVYRDSKS